MAIINQITISGRANDGHKQVYSCW